MRSRRVWLALAGLAACGEGDLSPHSRTLLVGPIGASIAVLEDGSVAVVDPDQGSVSLVDGQTLETIRRVDVGGEPRALLALWPDELFVLSYRSGEVTVVNPLTGETVRRATVCAGPRGIAATPSKDEIAVSCESDDTVVRLNPATLQVTPWAAGLTRPRAVAIVEGALVVADHTGGALHRIDARGEAQLKLVPRVASYRPALTTMTANLITSVAVSGPRLYASHLLLSHEGDAAGEQVAEDYGSVVDGHPKINPAVTAIAVGDTLAPSPAPVTYARFDGTAPILNGPSSLAAFGGHYLLVAHESSGIVAVIDVDEPNEAARVVDTHTVGAGPAGVAVDERRGAAYVDNAIDGSVSRIELAPTQTRRGTPTASTTKVRPLPPVFSALARAGRKTFFDASNRHLTKAGVVACSTCHPGGGDDGLVWFAHAPNIPLKRRRTPHLANARSTSAPFHWDGSLATMEDLVSSTVTDLMAGDGVLVDGTAVQAFIDEIVQPPPPRSTNNALVATGLAVFASRGCDTCHAGADGTDGRRHTVLDPVSLRADDAITAVDTPGLRGVGRRRDLFHDGRSPSLHDLLRRADATNHHGSPPLEAAEIDALIAYLATR